jgi:hypothetical protein
VQQRPRPRRLHRRPASSTQAKAQPHQAHRRAPANPDLTDAMTATARSTHRRDPSRAPRAVLHALKRSRPDPRRHRREPAPIPPPAPVHEERNCNRAGSNIPICRRPLA